VINDFIKKIRLLLHPKKESYFALYKILGFFPNHLSYYEEALRHKSSSHENAYGSVHYRNNERLEFLGDAVLDAIVADIIFKKYKNRNEGFLTNTRSKIVKRETLDRISGELGLNNLIITSGRIKFPKTHILGNALEAFIGAVYLDQGYRKTYRFVETKIINVHVNIDALVKKEVNFKSKLLEWCQKSRVKLTFSLLESFIDNDNNPIFQSQVLLNDLLAGIGTGYSKKESQQQAAQMALKKIKTDKIFLNTLKMNEEENISSPALITGIE
jgi:ribonuclease-3